MSKKFLQAIFIFSVAIALASCSSNNSFSFKNLTIDLSGAESLGMKAIQNNNVVKKDNIVYLSGQKIDFYSEIKNTQLVKINEKGETTLVDYYDKDGNLVEVPYYLFYFEIVGDFTYLVYYQSEQDLVSLNDAITNLSNFNSSMNTKTIDYFFYYNIGALNSIKKIIVHNTSEKVFDYTQIFNDIIGDNKSNISSFFTFKEGQLFSSFSNFENTCLYSVSFNEFTKELSLEESCSDVFYIPFFGFSNSNFMYYLDDGITNIMSKGMNQRLDLSQSVQRFYLNKQNEIFVVFSNHIVSRYDIEMNKLSDTLVLKETYNNEIIEIITIQDNKIYFRVSNTNTLVVFNLITELIEQEIDLNLYSSIQYVFDKHYYIENNLYLFSFDRIIKLDLVLKTIKVIYSGNRMRNNSELLMSYRSTGFFKITYTDGITTVTKTIDPITGEEISSNQSEVVKDVWFVKPLN